MNDGTPRLIGRVPLGLAAAAALALAQPPNASLLYGYVGIALWIATILGTSTRRSAFLGGLIGTAYGIAIAHWIPDALSGFGLTRTTGNYALVAAAAYVTGTRWALMSALIVAADRLRPFLRIVSVGLVVFVVEFSAARFPAQIPWGVLSLAFVDQPGLRQLAGLGGAPVVSAIVTMTVHALANTMAASRGPDQTRIAIALAAGSIALSTLGVVAPNLLSPLESIDRREPVHILAVQPNFMRSERWIWDAQSRLLAEIATQTETAIQSIDDSIDLVVWPELAITTPLDRDPALAKQLTETASNLGISITTGVARSPSNSTDGAYRNRAIWIDASGTIVDAVDKHLAVPLVESASPPWPISALGAPINSQVRGGRVETSGIGSELTGEYGVSIALCFEVLYPHVTAARQGDRSVAILNLADDSWAESNFVRDQLTAHAVYRAVEQRLPLIRLTHGGPSVSIDSFGRVVASIPYGTAGQFVSAVQPRSPDASPREYPVPLVVALGPLLAAWMMRRRAQRTF